MIEIDLSFRNWDHEIEQGLVTYRRQYDAASADDRKVAKEWVSKLVELERERCAVQALPRPHVCFRILEQFNRGEGDYEWVNVPAFILLRAMTAWDAGENYVPTQDDLWDVYP